MTAFAFDRSQMPFGIGRLPVDGRGYVVPWFVDRRADRGSQPDFRVADARKQKKAIQERRCWVCGLPIREPDFAFVAGPMCGVNRTSAEPPTHVECARWSARACPFLSFPKRVRDEVGLPVNRTVAGVGILRNPGVVMVWICRTYQTYRAGGVLFEIGEPSAVEWVCEGREATRSEVMESVRTGLPLLAAEANKEGPEAFRALTRMSRDFSKWIPAA